MKIRLFALVGLMTALLSVSANAAGACCSPGMSRTAADPAKQMLASYEQISNALAADDLAKAQEAGRDFAALAETIAEKMGCADGKMECPLGEGDCTGAVKALIDSENIESARKEFKRLSAQAIKLAKGRDDFYVMNCPMAGENGDWVQSDKELRNPYFGSQMLRCGTIKTDKS